MQIAQKDVTHRETVTVTAKIGNYAGIASARGIAALAGSQLRAGSSSAHVSAEQIAGIIAHARQQDLARLSGLSIGLGVAPVTFTPQDGAMARAQTIGLSADAAGTASATPKDPRWSRGS